MAKTGIQLLTRSRDEIPTFNRGERHWAKVEIAGERWFQVEIQGDKQGGKQLPFRSYILPDIETALDVLAVRRQDSWTQLRMYTRVPFAILDGFIFETVRQVLLTPEGTHIFLLKSGLIVCDSQDSLSRGLSLTAAEEIYSGR